MGFRGKMIRLVARLLEPRERALGNGIFTSGTSVGALLAPGLVLGISAALGWRCSAGHICWPSISLSHQV